jgi:hypothetical protein
MRTDCPTRGALATTPPFSIRFLSKKYAVHPLCITGENFYQYMGLCVSRTELEVVFTKVVKKLSF